MESLPIISFLYGGYWMESRPEDYLVDYEGSCWACFIEGYDEQQWLLGDSFLRGFYSTHDYATYQFGFAPHATSKKSAPVAGETPEEPMPEVSVGTNDDSDDYIYGYEDYYYGYYSYDYYSGYYYGYYGYGYYDYNQDDDDGRWVIKITAGHIAGAVVIATSVGMIIYGVLASN